MGTWNAAVVNAGDARKFQHQGRHNHRINGLYLHYFYNLFVYKVHNYLVFWKDMLFVRGFDRRSASFNRDG